MKLSDYPIPKNRSKRGFHWSASEYPEETHWQERLALCDEMGIGWLKFVDDGGASGMNVYRSCWHDHGIIPVVRFYIGAYGKCGQREADAIKRTADTLGFRTYFELWNELDLPIEWDNERPHNWQEIMIANYVQNAQKVWDAGGLLGTPALASGCLTQTRIDERGNVLEPLKYNWIKNCVDGVGGPQAAMNLGIWFSDHNYPINHDPDYPYDDVNQKGTPLTKTEYESVPSWAWDNRPMAVINAQRAKDKNTGDTIWDDDTCFRGFEIYLEYGRQAGLDCPLITTEGGPTLTRGDDGRYPKVTADIMCAWLPRMYKIMGQYPAYFGHCHWLLYNTTYGWESDRWMDGAEDYSKPKALFKATPVGAWDEVIGPASPVTEPPVIIPPEPTPTPVYPPLPVGNDASNYSVTIVSCDPPPGAWYWQIVTVHHLTPTENNGNHHAYMDVLDRTGQRINGARLSIAWPTGASFAVIDKPATEPGTNAPLTAGQVVTVKVAAGLSEEATGISTLHPAEPPVTAWGHDGNDVGHHSFLIVWREVQAIAAEPEPEPEPTPATPNDTTLRNYGWQLLGIPWLPAGAFYKKARALGLFGPRSPEGRQAIDNVTYAGQVFYGPAGDVLLWCVEGQWDQIQTLQLIE